jgi:RNA polymerase sigma-70 factor (ECF subfamily)
MDQSTRERAVLASSLESHLRGIYAYFRRLGVDAASAEDLVQETFITAWRNLRSLRDERKLRPWVYSIAFRCFLKHTEGVAARAPVAIAVDVAAGPMDDPGSDERLAAHVVHHMLRALPDEYLHPLVLVYWEDLSYQEAARVLSLPVGTLAWRVHKALKLMRQALAEKGTRDEDNPRKPQASRALDPFGKG